MRILTEGGYIDSVALFFELNDEQLEKVRNNKDYYQSREVLESLNKSEGENAHFFGICNNNKNRAYLIQDNLKTLLKQYKTVSWWDKDMNKFYIIGG